MRKQPTWEEVHFTPRAVGGFSTIVNRMSVPGGWIYYSQLIRQRTWGNDDIFHTAVFVPDPQSPG
jgi:hypothetical protein